MTRNRRSWACAALCLALTSPIEAADGPAEKLVAKIDAVELPPADSKKPADIARRKKAIDSRNALILELFKSHPSSPELARLMPERWRSRPATLAAGQSTKSEVDEILRKGKDERLIAEAAYFKAEAAIKKGTTGPKVDEAVKEIDDFAKRAPGDDRAPTLLYQLATAATDKARQARLLQRIKDEFPESAEAKRAESRGQALAIPKDREEMVGKPFVLEFADAITGKPVSIDRLKGKVVVIDFWATWCGPCVAEMPKMKELYAKHKAQGVEFIGVSLDQSEADGGLDSLRKFVAEREIGWPQFYQGAYWKGEFSSAWHVNSIPCVFLVDAEGNLVTTNARGKLDKLIPEYLEKAKERKTAMNP